MNRSLVDQIADAVLYEGYLLYPYRPSVKNRQRWTFGGLYPQSYSVAQEGTDPWLMQTECLVRQREGAGLRVRVRFLHLQERRTERLEHVLDQGFAPESLPAWQEAVEREVDLGEFDLTALTAQPQTRAFAFPSRLDRATWRGPVGEPLGTIVREQKAVAGVVELASDRVAEGLSKVTVRILNRAPFENPERRTRDEALLQALVSTHTILDVQHGEFVSLIDPPEGCSEAVADCQNIGAWPVLIGVPGEVGTMLSSPIILYDYPEIAPESPGDLFDSTEIDEILTLRILTLTDEEKKAMAAVDDRARTLLERTEALAREQLTGLHGAVRGMRAL